jgi:mono/diheme cytochrome c family protein
MPDRMSRPIRVLLIVGASAALAGFALACGTQKIDVPKTNGSVYRGAVLFSQRCSGCHTLSYAGTQGSASNVRTRLITNGPNFNVRCERPITRVLYAIENGGFSGAIMPQNIVTGQDARDVAQFVAQYAGRQAPKIVGQQTCQQTATGSLPSPTQTTETNTSTLSTQTGQAPKTATTPGSAVAPGATTTRGGKKATGSTQKSTKTKKK